jgi:translation initiation factor eIF-2B subunit epsilon
MNQIKEIIISSKYNRELIEEHTKKFKQQVKKIKVVATPDADNFGDSLRTVASMNLINDDFLIVRGDLISNINIHDALKMHYHIREEESKKENQTTETRKIKTIMTKLFLKRSHTNPLSDPVSEITLMMDNQTKEILKYQSLVSEHNRKQVKSIHVNEEHMPLLKSYAPPLLKGHQQKDDSLKCNNTYPNGSSIVIR